MYLCYFPKFPTFSMPTINKQNAGQIKLVSDYVQTIFNVNT